MKDSKTIIGYINQTIKGYNIIFGECTEERGYKIILALIGGMPLSDPETKKVLDYCQKHYNFNYKSL